MVFDFLNTNNSTISTLFVHLIIMQTFSLTLGGPMIIPFHLLMVISFSLSSPHETVPSDAPPFWPSSNSSNNLKLLGITFLWSSFSNYSLDQEQEVCEHKKTQTNLLQHHYLHRPLYFSSHKKSSNNSKLPKICFLIKEIKFNNLFFWLIRLIWCDLLYMDMDVYVWMLFFFPFHTLWAKLYILHTIYFCFCFSILILFFLYLNFHFCCCVLL